MATRLKNLVVEEVSLVDEPASPGARVLVFKRSDRVSRMNPATVFSRVLATLMKRDASAAERSEAAEELQAVLDPTEANREEDLDMTREELQEIIGGAVSKAVAPLTADIATLRKQMDEMAEEDKKPEGEKKPQFPPKKKVVEEEAKPEDEEAAMAKNASLITEAVRKAMAPLQGELETLRKAAREKELLGTYEDVIKASGLGQEKALELLGAMDEAGRAEFAKGIRALTARAAASGLFKSFGATTGPAADAEAELERLAKAKAEATNVTFEVAYDAVCKTATGRELYDRVINKAA
jgi:hypothetical protein